jgi:hypothetical protein
MVMGLTDPVQWPDERRLNQEKASDFEFEKCKV